MSSARWNWGDIELGWLSAAGSEEEYAIHRAAIEWTLDSPITISGPDDIESRRHWSEFFKPYEHQVRNLITFCRRAPVALIADDVGLGKTISAGLILSELMTRGKVHRALVLCPSILLPQWVEELETKFNIPARDVRGTGLKEVLRRPGSEVVVVTTYDSSRNNFDLIERAGFDMLLLDEAHKLRNLHGSNGNGPIFARKVHAALSRRVFKYVAMLTATPIQNRLWDLYSLIDCLAVAKGHQNPFGSPDRFAARYLADGKTKARQLNRGYEKEFRGILSQYMVRSRRVDCGLAFPSRSVETRLASACPDEWHLFDLVSEMIGELNALTQTSVAQALMSSPAALVAQLENMADKGTVSPSYARRARNLAPEVTETGKFKALQKLLKELRRSNPRDWRLVIFTMRKETQKAIGEALDDLDVRYGNIMGGAARENQRTVERFRADPPQIHVIVSTDAGAEGLNLQSANLLVNYDLPWNPMIVEQRIGRIQRLGSQHAQVFILNLVLQGSIEEKVVVRLIEKLQVIAKSIGDIEGVLEMVKGAEGDDGMERMIRSMVLDSLRKRDPKDAVDRAVKSIDRARLLYEEEQKLVEDNLGRLDEMHRAGPKMPKLAPNKPSWGPKEFVRRALLADGTTIRERSSDIWEVNSPSRGPEIAVFDEKKLGRNQSMPVVFGGLPERLFVPGKSDFERLVGNWTARAQHSLKDDESVLDASSDAAISEWIAKYPDLSPAGHSEAGRDRGIEAEVVVRCCAAVAHDRYEKLLSIEVPFEPRTAIGRGLDLRGREELDVRKVSSRIEQQIRARIDADEDVSAFCSFYLDRLEEELKKTGGDRRLEQLAKESFTPTITGTVVGVSGWLRSVLEIDVSYELDGMPIRSRLKAVPSGGTIIAEPETGCCEITGRTLPIDCLATCQVTGKVASRSRLVQSDVSGCWMLADEVRVCARSGAKLLPSEAGKSDLSGAVVDARLLLRSELSGRVGCEDETRICDFTGDRVLRDEILVSQVSGKSFRRDHLGRSVESGIEGHLSEFRRCEASGDLLLPEEGAESDVSGRFFRPSLLESSQKNPERKGAKDEVVTCEVTGLRLLADEAGKSAVSGRVVDLDLLVSSARSERRALREEMAVCEKSGAILLPDETDTCAVTGLRVDDRLLGTCAVTGRRALVSELRRCAVTGEAALPESLVTCEVSGARILPRMADRCSVSGKLVDRRLLEKSAVSDRVALAEHFETCSVTGERALTEEMITCEASGCRLVEAFAESCCVTGKRVDPRLLEKSAVSSRKALKDQLEVCAVSGKRVIPDELEPCGVTGKRALPEYLATCFETKTRALKSQCVESDLSKRWMLRSVAVRSGFSSRLGGPSEVVECDWSGQPMLRDERRSCHQTGINVHDSFLDPSGVLRPLLGLQRSPQSGQPNPQMAAWLSTQAPEFQKVKRVWTVESPTRHATAVHAEFTAMLGLVRKHKSVIVRERPAREIIGKTVEGR